MNKNLSETESLVREDASYAKFVRRAGAYAVDIAIVGTAVMASQFGIQALTGGFPANQFTSGWQIEAWVFATVSVPTWAYFTLMERSSWQATVGKRLAGIRVTDIRGDRIGFGRALLRTIVKLLPWEITHLSLLLPTPMWSEGPSASLRPGLIVANVLLLLYIATALLTPRKQSVHDLVAGTVVQRRDV